MTKPNWKPQKIKLGQIQAWDNNPRMSTKAQAQRIIASERKFGQPVPFLVAPEADGRFLLYDGHQRLAAWFTVYGADYQMDAMVADRPLTEAEHKELIITLHTGATGSWDWQALSGWSAGDLQEWGMNGDALKSWNNDANNLKELLTAEVEPVDAEPQTDRAGELAEKWQTASGQLWKLGDHRLLIGDCTVRENVERLMGGELADMVLTDPPYNVEYEGNYIQSGEILKKEQKIWSGGIENDNRSDFAEWLLSVYKSINEFMDEGCAIYIWHPPGSDGKYFWTSWLWELWHFQVDLVWNKKSLIISRWDYKPQHEPCMYGWKGKNRKWTGENNEATVWDLARQQGNSGEERLHPTQKPPALFEMAIKNHPTNAIFDPFCGSGTTIIAAHNLNRRCFAMEISEKYGAVILQRFLDATGIQPELQL